MRGARQAIHQVLRCPACTQRVFVLARSPYPPPESLHELLPAGSKQSLPPASAARPPSWRGPILAGALALVAVSATIYGLIAWLASSPSADSPKEPPGVRRLIEAGRQALADEHFTLAAEKLDAAAALARQQASILSADERKELDQLQRQAAVLSRLLSESLEEILARGARTRDLDEWKRQFAGRYAGQAVVFDTEVRRQQDHRYELDYAIQAENRQVRLNVDDLQLLAQLDHHGLLDRPRRLFFGVRLASILPEEGGIWVIRFQSDSGVLLTDANAAAACLAEPLDDELREVIEQQAAWLKQWP
jgi:hypothetical protein